MHEGIKRKLLFSGINRKLIHWSKKVMLPGFGDFSLYHISRFFFQAIFNGQLITRAAAIAFQLFLSLFPALIVLLTLIPFIPVQDFQEKLLGTFRSMLPMEVYDFIEGLLHDLLLQKHSALLSVSFLLGLFFASNSINAILVGFSSSRYAVNWYKPLKQRLISLLVLFLFTVLSVTATAVLTLSNWGHSLIHASGHLMSGFENVVFQVVRWSITVALMLTAISMLYHFGTPGKRKFHYITPGAILALVLMVLLSQALAFIFQHVTNYNALYGSIGVILAVQLWLYLNMIVLLVGYELNSSIAKAHREHSASLKPVFGGALVP